MLPPGPSSHPFFNMVRWVRRPLPMLEQLAATYGPVFSVRIPRMPEPMVFFSDPAAIKDIWTATPTPCARARRTSPCARRSAQARCSCSTASSTCANAA